ncbi:MAG: NUDIX hydrolase [Paracoccaceae bacterium]
MTTDPGFAGAKAALFCGDALLACLRDTHPGLPWPGMWDLPGGGREGEETAEACLLRELDEEFGLCLAPHRLVFRAVLPSLRDPAISAVFFAGRITRAEVASIRFGGEGQGWALMPVQDFLSHPKAIPGMQQRVRLALNAGEVPR